MSGSFFNLLDYFYILIVLVSCLVGFFRGFFKDFFGSCAWLGSGFLSTFIAPYLANFIQEQKLISNPIFAKIAAIFIAFLVVLITLLLMINSISKRVHNTVVSGLDRACGALYGFARGFIILLILCLGLIMFNLLDFKREFIANSKITSILVNVAEYLIPKIASAPQVSKKVSRTKKKTETVFSDQEMQEMEQLAKGVIKKEEKIEETESVQEKGIRRYLDELIARFTRDDSNSQDVPRKAPGTGLSDKQARIKNKEDNVPFGCMDLMKARAKRRAQKKAKRIQRELLKRLDNQPR